MQYAQPMTLLLDRPVPVVDPRVDPVVDDVTRREVIVGGAALAALFAVPAGWADASSPPTSTPGTVSVTDVAGTRDLPARPQRVICLDGSLDLELAALCGFTVIGYYDRSTEGVELPETMSTTIDGAESLPFEPNLEQLAELAPDLLITESTYWLDEIGRERLEAIAPLLVTQRTAESGQWDWRKEFAYFAGVFGQQARAEAAFARYDDAVAELRRDAADAIASTTLSVVQFNSATGAIVMHPPTNVLVGYVVDDLGGTFSDAQVALTEPLVMEAESIGMVDGDVIVRVAFDLSPGAFDGLEANPLWPALPAVEAGRVTDTAVLITNFGGPAVAVECVAMLTRAYALAAT